MAHLTCIHLTGSRALCSGSLQVIAQVLACAAGPSVPHFLRAVRSRAVMQWSGGHLHLVS